MALVQNVHGRRGQSLNGLWRYVPDPYGFGKFSPFGGEHVQSWFKNHKPRDESERIEYDFDSAETLEVPGDWNTQDATLLYYEGMIWYQRNFSFELEAGERAFLCFGGANYQAEVGVNGETLGSHVGGFTPFQFEITEQVQGRTDHFVVVRVDNTRRRETVPTLATDWWNYGGLTRDVRIVRVPETFIRDYRLELVPGTRDRVRGSVQLDGSQAANATVRVELAGETHTFTTDAQGRAALEIQESELQLWSPDDPMLYDVRISAGRDQVADRIGFRTIETRGSEILLNGEPIFLRGISLHEEAPLREGRATNPEDARVNFAWARELGCNFVRLAHYPHNEHTVRIADELGFLIWAELPVYWNIDWDNPDTQADAQNQLRELIERDANRASVVLWSVGNEAPPSEPRLRFMTELAELARELDGTRLITAALLTFPTKDKAMHINDPLGEVVDVIGVNEYFGWYYLAPEQASDVEWSSEFDKPLILSELGAGARQGHHGRATQRWTEEFQAEVYVHQIAMMKRIPFLAGLSPWILRDFRSPNRTLPGIQDGYNRKGLLSHRGIKKQAFWVLRDFYEERGA